MQSSRPPRPVLTEEQKKLRETLSGVKQWGMALVFILAISIVGMTLTLQSGATPIAPGAFGAFLSFINIAFMIAFSAELRNYQKLKASEEELQDVESAATAAVQQLTYQAGASLASAAAPTTDTPSVIRAAEATQASSVGGDTLTAYGTGSSVDREKLGGGAAGQKNWLCPPYLKFSIFSTASGDRKPLLHSHDAEGDALSQTSGAHTSLKDGGSMHQLDSKTSSGRDSPAPGGGNKCCIM